jgi:hypothetical protein
MMQRMAIIGHLSLDMKRFLIPFLPVVLIVTSCHNPEIASGVPSCIYTDINQISKDPQSFVGSVKEYQFQGKVVYAFEPDTKRIADGTTAIKDAECKTLCHVGGFAGPANNQCIGGNFFKDAVYKRTIWEKK